MKIGESQAVHPPRWIDALRAGFDTVANHIGLIFFPVILDLFLWLGPRLRLTALVHSISDRLTTLYQIQDPSAGELLKASQEGWALLAQQLNVMVALRSYPVGIPSLMAYVQPIGAPVGAQSWEIRSFGGVFLAWLLITAFGLLLGTLFFEVVSQATLSRTVRWRESLGSWPRLSVQVFFLAIFWLVIVICLMIPGTIILSLAALGGLAMVICGALVFGFFALGLVFPLLFSPHGIFAMRLSMVASLRNSIQLTRRTYSSTMVFFFSAFVLAKGLDLLWQTPADTSWLLLVGIAGHAFITTSLLAASFVYYRDADLWIHQDLLRSETVGINS
jgi:hypothetical protein